MIPTPKHREVDGFDVFSFYRLSDIEDLIKSKYYFLGAKIYQILARRSLSLFAKDLELEDVVDVVPIDDNIKKGYAHSAVLAKALKSKNLKPKYGALIAKNDIQYAGKSLEFREKNPKGFELIREIRDEVILVDDVITTGQTIKEAKNLLEKKGKKPLFALVLADARE